MILVRRNNPQIFGIRLRNFYRVIAQKNSHRQKLTYEQSEIRRNFSVTIFNIQGELGMMQRAAGLQF